MRNWFLQKKGGTRLGVLNPLDLLSRGCLFRFEDIERLGVADIFQRYLSEAEIMEKLPRGKVSIAGEKNQLNESVRQSSTQECEPTQECG